MATEQAVERIVADDVMDGEPRIRDRRVTVLYVYEQVEERGLKTHTVADRHELDVADVYHALAYYHDNPEEMQDVREHRQSVIAEHRDRGTTPTDLDGE